MRALVGFVLMVASVAQAFAEARINYVCDIPKMGRSAVVFMNSDPSVSVLLARKGPDGVLIDYEKTETRLINEKGTFTYVGRIHGHPAAFWIDPAADDVVRWRLLIRGYDVAKCDDETDSWTAAPTLIPIPFPTPDAHK